jgi:hypothetical protein
MVKGGIFLPFFGGCSKRKQEQGWIGLMGPMGLMWHAPNGAEWQTPNAKRTWAFLGWLLLLRIVDNFALKNAPLAWQI